MKTNAKSIMALSSLAVVALALVFWSFKRPDNGASLSQLKTTMVEGKWKVNLYRDNGADETNNYTGYEFQFKSNGTVLARNKDNSELNGSWRSVAEDGTKKVYMEFDPASHLNELSEDWLVILNTKNALVFEDFTTGHSGSDYLSFEKIS